MCHLMKAMAISLLSGESTDHVPSADFVATSVILSVASLIFRWAYTSLGKNNYHLGNFENKLSKLISEIS